MQTDEFLSFQSKRNKTKLNNFFRAILKETKENEKFLPPRVKQQQKNQWKWKTPAKLQEKKEENYKETCNLVQTSEIKVKKTKSFMCTFANVS